MSDGLKLEWFRRLAESYGADIEKWPETVRQPARIAALKAEAQTILNDEIKLDAMLGAWSVAAMPDELAKLASANAVASRHRLMRKVSIWWTSIGIAAALSGAATGTAATALLGHSPQAYNSTIFGDLDDGDD